MLDSTSTNNPGFLFPAVKPTTSSEHQITSESQSFSTDQGRSHDKQPSSHTSPEDEETILVTHVHYDVLKSRTTVSNPTAEQLPRGDQDQGKGQVWMPKPRFTSVTSAPNGESETIYVTSNTLSVSVRNVNEPTQPLFNGKSKSLTVKKTPSIRFQQTKRQIRSVECTKNKL